MRNVIPVLMICTDGEGNYKAQLDLSYEVEFPDHSTPIQGILTDLMNKHPEFRQIVAKALDRQDRVNNNVVEEKPEFKVDLSAFKSKYKS